MGAKPISALLKRVEGLHLATGLSKLFTPAREVLQVFERPQNVIFEITSASPLISIVVKCSLR